MIRRVVTQDDHVQLYALTARGVVMVSMLLGLAVTGMVLAVLALAGATHVQNTTCAIQSRGLSAQKALTSVMSDLAIFVEARPGVKQKALPAPYSKALANLRIELPAYTQIESAQPTYRVC